MSEPQMAGRRRRSLRLYLILAGVAAVLAGVVLAVAPSRNGHLSRYEWLGIALLGVAVVTAVFIAIGTRRSGATGIRVTRAGSAGPSGTFLETASSVLTIIASIFTVIATLLPLIPRSQVSSHLVVRLTNPCAIALSGPAHSATLSSSQYQGDIQVSDVFYSLYSDDPDAATAQLHSAMYGRLIGRLPQGFVIYAVGLWDSRSTSISTHVHGYPHYYPRGEIRPGSNGCWSVPSRDVGEPHSVGLTERIFFMLANSSAARVLEQAEGKVDERAGTGLTQAQINSLNVIPVDAFELDTTNYDRVAS